MLEKPLVSTIITTYKRPYYLRRAIYSVLEQTYDNIEIIVVDDNNPNTNFRKMTEKLMKEFNSNSRVKYYKHKNNKNGAAARNTGIKVSSGKYVNFLDDDDEFTNDKIEKQVEALEDSKYDAAYCGWQGEGIEERPVLTGNLLFEVLSGELLIRTGTIMMNREKALLIGGWDVTYRRNQEVGFLSKYFMQGFEMTVASEPLLIRDMSDRQNASNPKKSEEDYLFMLHDQKDAIDYASKIKDEDKKIIYSYRLRTICLKYLAGKNYCYFLRAYFFSSLRFPIRFNYDFIRYIVDKLF